MHRIRQYVRRAILVLVAIAAVTGIGEGYKVYENWREAGRCLALTSNMEGNVLDARGELLIDEVVLNRARQIPGTASFFQKVCQAALAKHWSTPLQKRFPNFSALAHWWYVSPKARAGWHRSMSIANHALWGWELGSKQLLPRNYTFYHTTPAPPSFMKENGLACDLRHRYGKYGLDFCRKGKFVRPI